MRREWRVQETVYSAIWRGEVLYCSKLFYVINVNVIQIMKSKDKTS